MRKAYAAILAGSGLLLAGAWPVTALESTVPPTIPKPAGPVGADGPGLPHFPNHGAIGRRARWGHRHDGGHWWWIVLALALAAIVVLAVVALRRRESSTGSASASPTATAEAILAERLARGEITAEEYTTARDALKS